MPKNIPLYALYGEENWLNTPGFVHCEDIAKRSSDLGWKIGTHRHTQLFQCLIIERGHVSFWLDDNHFDTSEKCVIWIPPNTVHSFDFLPGTLGRVISFTEDFFSNPHDASLRTLISNMLITAGCIFYSAEALNFKQLIMLCAQLETELIGVEVGQGLMTQSLISALLINIYRRQEELGRINSNSTNKLWWDFKRLLEDNYRQHWSVTEYANALSITPSRLNRLSKMTTQKGIKFHTQQRLFVESKRKLLFTRQSVDEITYEIGFKDPGYFCRFFKKLSNVTPSEFREKHSP